MGEWNTGRRELHREWETSNGKNSTDLIRDACTLSDGSIGLKTNERSNGRADDRLAGLFI